MPGQSPAVCVPPVPPGLAVPPGVVVPPGVPDGAVVADGSGLAALTTATPPTANSPADRTIVAIVRRSPLGSERRAAGRVVAGASADMFVSFIVSSRLKG
jgi:hypothetical protein